MHTGTNHSRFPLFDQIDQGINQFVNDVLKPEVNSDRTIPCSAWEHEDRYTFQFDLPGVALADIELQVFEGVVEVSGQRKTHSAENATVTLDEQPTGSFLRRLRLARDVNLESVDAELDAGVLTVTLRKVAQATPRSVQIRSGSHAIDS